MLVYAGASGLSWAVIDGAKWGAQGNLDPVPWNAAHPRFYRRPSGGYWLQWTSLDWMHVSSYRDGVWSRGDSLAVPHAAGLTFTPGWCDASRDTFERPVLIWGDIGYGYTLPESVAIAFPTESGWARGEDIPGSERPYLTPVVERDVNSDVWAMWDTRNFTDRWTHTYTSATASAPLAQADGAGARLRWTLTPAAPFSRWTVLRAAQGGAFEERGTVTAGKDSVLSWRDPDARAGTVWRYCLRRECLDTRYLWWSDTTTYWRPDTSRPLGLRAASPFAGRLALTVTGGSGVLVVRLYDLQGREVLRREYMAGGRGDDALALELAGASTRAGIYFVRVSDGTGRRSSTAKVALIP
jgi:hypothetical protein